MINSLSVKGFKCFDDIIIYPKAMTLLVGKNSAGKSSIIQAILSLKQGGNNPFRGTIIKIGEISELMNSYIGAESITIEAYDSSGEKASIYVSGYSDSESKVDQLDTEIVYCSAERVGVEDTYEKNIDDNDEVGADCKYAFYYLYKHKNDSIDDEFVYDQKSLLTIGGQVDYWLSEIVGYETDVDYLKDTDWIQIKYKKKKGITNNLLSRPKNVGTGVTYVASIVISAFSCKKGGILIIENPEIHLHPAAQSKLLEFLSFISLCGVQVIIETHSDHIFNGIRKCVHNNLIEVENQSIYFFKDKENGCSEPILIKLGEDGKICCSEEGLFDQIQKDLDVILDW